MLSRIIMELRKADGLMDLNKLGQRLVIDRSALEGMLESLVRQGKLREIGTGSEECARRAGCLNCSQKQTDSLMVKGYELADLEKSRVLKQETDGGIPCHKQMRT